MQPDQAKTKQPQCLKNSSRRQFIIGSGSSVVLSCIPGLSYALNATEQKYSHKKIAQLSDLKTDTPILFRYPFDDIYSTNFLVKLGEIAGGGIGNDKDVVAFNSLCPHMGGPLAGIYNAKP